MDAGNLFIAVCLLLAWLALLLVSTWLIEYIIPAKWVDKLCNTIGWRVRWEDEPLTVRRRHKNRVSYIRQMLQVWKQNNRLFSKKRRPFRSDM